MLRELGQVGALLLVLLFCPKQNLRNLKKQVDWIEPRPAGSAVTQWLLSLGDKQLHSPGPGTALPQPHAWPYLYLIKELGIQQCQLLSYLMTVKVMQGPGPGRQRHEMSGQWTGRWGLGGGCTSGLRAEGTRLASPQHGGHAAGRGRVRTGLHSSPWDHGACLPPCLRPAGSVAPLASPRAQLLRTHSLTPLQGPVGTKMVPCEWS